MSILTKSEILKEIKKKNIKITPFNKKNIGPASIDLTLSSEFRVFDAGKEIKIDKHSDYRQCTRRAQLSGPLKLNPGGFVLGITKETIKLPDNICGWLGGRTRYARLGLQIHITAAFVHPGVNNKQVLEIYNASPEILLIYPGTKICQLILERTEGKANYKGKFKRQNSL